MSRFSSLAAGLALALIIVPSVSAQPLRIIVTRPNVIIVEPSLDPPASRSPVYDYRDVLPFDFRFNPGRAAELSVVGRIADPAIDLVRAVILDREGISMAEHQLRCQQLYPGYDPVSNTYYGPDGVPQYCSL